MNGWILAILTAASLHAAVVRGTVVNHDGGEPLGQTVVVMKAIQGSGSGNFSAKTDPFGVFVFPVVPGGAYLLTATRPFFLQALYGQKRWNSAGLPLVIEANDSTMLNIRMHRYGAITGRVVDENDVGIPGHEVVAYRRSQPTQVVARATTDDYGRYRIYGLTPDTYLVRSVAKRVDGMSYVPTWAPGVQDIDQARLVEVLLDLDVPAIDVHPAEGRLFDVSGNLADNMQTELTLAGETGRQTLTVFIPFKFEPVPPGDYELYAEAPDAHCLYTYTRGLYQLLPMTEDRNDLNLAMSCVPETRVSYSLLSGAMVRDPQALLLRARRKDLAGVAKEINLGRAPTSISLPPGRWELLLQATSAYAVVGVSPSSVPMRNQGRADGWNEINATEANRGIRFTLTNNPNSIHGVVTGASHEPVMGAPVYLEGYLQGQKGRVGELRTVYTDSKGVYQFDGLAPGSYRILATFEYTAPESALMEECGARTLTLFRSADTTSQDLDLFVLK